MAGQRKINQVQYGDHGKEKTKQKVKEKFRNKPNQIKMTIMGVNAAGISSKISRFKNVLRLRLQGKLKLENTSNYVIYELNRKDKNGGGLAIGVMERLKPVWITKIILRCWWLK